MQGMPQSLRYLPGPDYAPPAPVAPGGPRFDEGPLPPVLPDAEAMQVEGGGETSPMSVDVGVEGRWWWGAH